MCLYSDSRRSTSGISKAFISAQRDACDIELNALRKSMSARRKRAFVRCASSVMASSLHAFLSVLLSLRNPPCSMPRRLFLSMTSVSLSLMMWLTSWWVLLSRMIGRRSDVLSEVAPPLWSSEIIPRVSSSVISVGFSGSRMVLTHPRRISFSSSDIALICSFWRVSWPGATAVLRYVSIHFLNALSLIFPLSLLPWVVIFSLKTPASCMKAMSSTCLTLCLKSVTSQHFWQNVFKVLGEWREVASGGSSGCGSRTAFMLLGWSSQRLTCP